MNLLEICKQAVLSYDQQTGCLGELEYNIKYTKKIMVVSVRGTEASNFMDVLLKGGWRDVIRDIRFIPRHHKTLGWCHGGFLRGAVKLVEELKRIHIVKDRTIIFTGHSMGAAVSLLAAHLMFEEHSNIKWVGFGCPKPFIGHRLILFPAIHVVNGDDIATTSPRGWLFDYQLNVSRTIQLGDTSQNPSIADHAAHEYFRSTLLYSGDQMEV